MIPRGITLSNTPFLPLSWGSSSAKGALEKVIHFPFAVATSTSCFSHYLTVQAAKASPVSSNDSKHLIKKSAKFTFPWNITFAAFHEATRKESIMYKIWFPEILKILRIIPTWLVGVPQSVEWQYLPFPQRNPSSLSPYLSAHRKRREDNLRVRHFQKRPQIKRTLGSGVKTFLFLVLHVFKGHLALVYNTQAERKRCNSSRVWNVWTLATFLTSLNLIYLCVCVFCKGEIVII